MQFFEILKIKKKTARIFFRAEIGDPPPPPGKGFFKFQGPVTNLSDSKRCRAFLYFAHFYKSSGPRVQTLVTASGAEKCYFL